MATAADNKPPINHKYKCVNKTVNIPYFHKSHTECGYSRPNMFHCVTANCCLKIRHRNVLVYSDEILWCQQLCSLVKQIFQIILSSLVITETI